MLGAFGPLAGGSQCSSGGTTPRTPRCGALWGWGARRWPSSGRGWASSRVLAGLLLGFWLGFFSGSGWASSGVGVGLLLGLGWRFFWALLGLLLGSGGACLGRGVMGGRGGGSWVSSHACLDQREVSIVEGPTCEAGVPGRTRGVKIVVRGSSRSPGGIVTVVGRCRQDRLGRDEKILKARAEDVRRGRLHHRGGDPGCRGRRPDRGGPPDLAQMII